MHHCVLVPIRPHHHQYINKESHDPAIVGAARDDTRSEQQGHWLDQLDLLSLSNHQTVPDAQHNFKDTVTTTSQMNNTYDYRHLLNTKVTSSPCTFNMCFKKDNNGSHDNYRINNHVIMDNTTHMLV